jgi:hypothetical protein
MPNISLGTPSTTALNSTGWPDSVTRCDSFQLRRAELPGRRALNALMLSTMS